MSWKSIRVELIQRFRLSHVFDELARSMFQPLRPGSVVEKNNLRQRLSTKPLMQDVKQVFTPILIFPRQRGKKNSKWFVKNRSIL
jgi:hypothetical protein